MFTIMEDTCGRHDFTLTPCSKDTFRIIYGENEERPGCEGNLAAALAPYDIGVDRIPIAFNVFMHVAVDATTGEFRVLPPLSKAGDFRSPAGRDATRRGDDRMFRRAVEQFLLQANRFPGCALRSHWLKVGKELRKAASANVGDTVTVKISPADQEPEPTIPDDLQEALAASAAAKAVWDDTTTIARLDWIHWIESAKQEKTRKRRVENACEMLAAGKKRVCCFDQSGFYSKSLSAPKAAD
jgi:hypothetical protein